MKVKILGEDWDIQQVPKNSDPDLEDCDGYTDWTVKKVVAAIIPKGHPGTNSVMDPKQITDKVTRHELIHAALYQCGLAFNSPWATNEEMVDWFAIQMPMLVKLMVKVGCLEVET